MYEYEIEDITNEKEPFVINTDGKADWACKVIKQEETELDKQIKKNVRSDVLFYI